MAAIAGSVNGSCHDLFSCSGFTRNEYRGTARSDQPYALRDLLHGPAFSDQQPAPRFRLAVTRYGGVFRGALRVCGHVKKTGGIPMLENMKSTQPQKANDIGGPAVRCVNYDGRTGLGLLQFFQEAGCPGPIGNREAEQNDIEILAAEQAEPIERIAR